MDVEDRLRNWARYYRPRMSLHTCGSAEGNFRSNWRQWVSLAEIQHSAPIDVLDANRVEEAWQMLIYRHKLVLKLCFMTKAPAYWIARKVGVKTWKLDHEYGRAVNSIRNRLEVIDNERELRYCRAKPEPAFELRDIRPDVEGEVSPKETQPA